MFARKRLERRLRSERPAPDGELVSRMRARIDGEGRAPRRIPGLRVGVAIAVAVGAVAVAGAAGGLTYAADAITQTTSSVAHAIGGTSAPDLSTSTGSSSSSTSSTSLSSANVAAADAQYATYYCYQQKQTGDYKKTQTTQGNGWILVWGPDSSPDAATRSCP